MSMIRPIFILLLFQLAGELLRATTHIEVPGPVIMISGSSLDGSKRRPGVEWDHAAQDNAARQNAREYAHLPGSFDEAVGDQWGGQGKGELRLPPSRLDTLAAGEVPTAAGALRALSGVGGASFRTGPFDLLDLRATVSALDASVQAVCTMPVPGAARRAAHPVPA